MSSGRFTPILRGAVVPGNHTYSVQDGEYILDGGRVNFWLKVQTRWRDPLATGGLQIGGLPLAALRNGLNSVVPVNGSFLTLDAGYTQVNGLVLNGQNCIDVIEQGSGVVTQVLGVSAFAATIIMCSGAYLAGGS